MQADNPISVCVSIDLNYLQVKNNQFIKYFIKKGVGFNMKYFIKKLINIKYEKNEKKIENINRVTKIQSLLLKTE